MTTDEIASAMKTIFEKRKILSDYSEQRKIEEQALSAEYKVDECNTKRNAIMKKYSDMINSVNSEIMSIENSLGA